jgi:hypothetical protein
MADGIVHEVSCPEDEKHSSAADAGRWPNSAAVLEALAALEAEFNAILKPGAPASK